MKIAVIGSGYVGTTTAALLAHSGHEVWALDIDQNKVKTLNSGRSPFYEIHLDELISEAVQKNTLTATTNYEEAITGADIVISCVGTPDNPDGSSNLQYVMDAAKKAAPLLKKESVYVQKSTVPVGTGRKVITLLPDHIAYVSNPEFLREGTAIYDTVLFDRIVAGGDDHESVERILSLYKDIEAHAQAIAAIATTIPVEELKDHTGSYIHTTLESAELIKVTANAFLALKISFANSIAKLCDETGADVVGVMDGIGSDRRIGRAFLNAGRGYGGGCFPKDVSGLITSALEYGVDMPIMTAATEVNESMAGYTVRKAERAIGSFKDVKATVLGLAFKAGTSDARKSPAVKIANLLVKAGAEVTAFDPEATEEAKEDLAGSIQTAHSVDEAVNQAEVIFITTDWPDFKDATNVLKNTNAKILVDCMNCIDTNSLTEGITYLGIGR